VLTNIANFGGTIADLWPHHETGVAMSLYLWAATCGSPSGFLILALVAEGRRWQDVFWALLTVCSVFWVIMVVAVRETRHTTILKRRRQGSGITTHRTARELFQVALARPFRFLATEAIVIFAALYNGYLFGLSFLFNGVFVLVFGKEGHGYSIAGVGVAFLGLVVGISAGVVTNIWQERRYLAAVREAGGANIPEARVHLAKTAAVCEFTVLEMRDGQAMLTVTVFPVSMLCFAWTTMTWIPPIVPVLASAVWGWCFYTMILMTVVYIGDSYGVSAWPSILSLVSQVYILTSLGLHGLCPRRYRPGPQRGGCRFPIVWPPPHEAAGLPVGSDAAGCAGSASGTDPVCAGEVRASDAQEESVGESAHGGMTEGIAGRRDGL